MPLLVCRVGARRVRVTADVRVEWPERRGSAARRETWERRGRGLGGSALPPALSSGGAVGGGVVCCRWRAMEGLGGGARALACVSNGPRGGGASLVVRRMSVGDGAWGPVPPLPPALSPCARAGLCARGSSPRDARDTDAVADRVTLGGAACAGWVPCFARGDAGRAGLSATGSCCVAPPWWLCVTCGRAHVPVWWEESASPLPADMCPSSSSSEPARH